MPIRAIRTRRALTVLAAAVTAALLPAAAPPAAASPATVLPAEAVSGPAPVPVSGSAPAPVPAAGGAGLVTLVTGDRVRLDGAGRVTAVLPAEGREHIPVQALRDGDGHTHVIPEDATALVLDGTVDRRLFDVTELSRPAFRALHGDILPFIVRYEESGPERDGPAAGRRLRAAAGDAGVRPLRSIGADAVAAGPGDTAAAWAALTRASGEGGRRTTAPGVASLWLDGLVRAELDRSVRQIGVPAAWEAGLDGEGVTIAVLDSGIDTTHPDLAGPKVAAAKNFSASPGTTDRYGHGTHVASIAAGTGAASGGAYRGVAPGARLLNAKVIGDDNSGRESDVIAGMEWAVAQGADVVNLSVGAGDAPGVGPMEEAVNRLSAGSGPLFVAAAGNAGPRPGSISSPGSAEAALTVGAVDREDRLAGFSSVGPRTGDGGLKPDLTAPGTGIGAALAEGSVLAGEAGPVADGYGSLSGTSMATPHAAGAAALLAERHPDWNGERIKAALTGSAAAGESRSVFEQGSGRVDAGRAAGQTLVAGTSSVGFGAPRWPHTDDEPVTRDLVHRNLGEKDLTLTLSAEATGPDGEPAPEGMFVLEAERITVPAGGAVATGLTADTRPGGDRYGEFEVVVTASGGGQSVRTAGAVTREEESYDLTVNTVGRDGAAPADWAAIVYDYERGGFTGTTGTGGAATVRLPEGTYLVSHQIVLAGGDGGDGDAAGLDWQLQPRLDLTADTTLTFDARKAEPVEITVPDPEAELADAAMSFDATVDGRTIGSVWLVRPPLPLGFRTRHVGPELPDGRMHAKTVGSFRSGPDTEYRVAYGREGGLFTGFRKDVAPEELAELTIHQGASATGRQGAVITEPDTGDIGFGWTVAHLRDLPGTFTQYLNTEGVRWSHRFEQMRGEEREAVYAGPQRAAYTAGEAYEHTYNTGVFGPLLGGGGDGGGGDGGDGAGGDGLFRRGDTLSGRINPLADGAGHRGESLHDTASTTLYRNGEPYATAEDVLDRAQFTLPPEKADYRLVTTVARGGPATVSREVTSSWTFTSEAAGEGERVRLPASAVRFTPRLAPDSTVPAGSVTEVPVTVQGSAAGDGAGPLTVHASFDGGRTWTELPVRDGAVKVRNPAEPGTGVSLRAEVTGGAGHALTQTILDAYRTR